MRVNAAINDVPIDADDVSRCGRVLDENVLGRKLAVADGVDLSKVDDKTYR